jgi:hypothetical protein
MINIVIISIPQILHEMTSGMHVTTFPNLRENDNNKEPKQKEMARNIR